tara:strand:- start:2288 stop:2539 length:252 start_codon:yes stop_codon:yes gene_type:complete
MGNDLVLDVSGSWVRRAKTSAADELNRFSDAAEKLFITQHRENLKPIRVNHAEREDNFIEKSRCTTSETSSNTKKYFNSVRKL